MIINLNINYNDCPAIVYYSFFPSVVHDFSYFILANTCVIFPHSIPVC